MSDYCPCCSFDTDGEPHEAVGVSFYPRAHIHVELMRVRGSVSLFDKLAGLIEDGREPFPKTRHFLKVNWNTPDHRVIRWSSFPINFCPMCGRDLRDGE